MSESSVSDVELSPSTDSLDTHIGFATEAGRTTAVSQSSSSAGQPPSLDNALVSSDSESSPVPPQAAEGEGTQNGRPDRVGLPAPPTGEHGEPAAAGASAPTTGPGHQPPPADILAILASIQAQQRQQQEILAALLGRQQSGPGEARTLPAFPFPPAPPSANQGQGHLPPPTHPPAVRSARPDLCTSVSTPRHRPQGARHQRWPSSPQRARTLPAWSSKFPPHLPPLPGSERGQGSTFPRYRPGKQKTST